MSYHNEILLCYDINLPAFYYSSTLCQLIQGIFDGIRSLINFRGFNKTISAQRPGVPYFN